MGDTSLYQIYTQTGLNSFPKHTRERVLKLVWWSETEIGSQVKETNHKLKKFNLCLNI